MRPADHVKERRLDAGGPASPGPGPTLEPPMPQGDCFLSILDGALALAREARPLVRGWLDQGIARLFFMGAGGAQLLMEPALDLLRRQGTFPAAACYPAQVMLDPPAGLDRRALVVIPSLSGTARESVELLGFLSARGVATLTLTGHRDTSPAQRAERTCTDFAEAGPMAESLYLQTLILALALLAETGAIRDYDALVAELARLPPLLAAARRAYEPEAARLAASLRDEPYHIVTGAGTVWPQAHYLAMCRLEQRQHIRIRPVHAADFFHGTLELVEPGVSVIVLKGEDALRPLSDRVDRFARRYTDKVWVLDAALADLPGLSPRLRALVSSVVLASLLEPLSAHLAALRGPSPPPRPCRGVDDRRDP